MSQSDPGVDASLAGCSLTGKAARDSLIDPICVELPPSFSIADIFDRFARRPGCIWFDSASDRPAPQTRYSFLTCDPVQMMEASLGGPDPWPQLLRQCRDLPKNLSSALPPFQGGIAGLIGYEASTWLEDIQVAGVDDLPTPAVSLGLYDWSLATDHHTNRSWIIARDFDSSRTHSQQTEHATRRIEWVRRLLDGEEPGALTVAAGWDQEAATRSNAPLAKQYLTDRADITSNFASDVFRGRVAEIVKRIRRGDSFQVNLAQRLLVEARDPPHEVYRSLRKANPAPFAAYYNGGAFQVLSSSPEGFLKVDHGHVETRPIKGTTPRVGQSEADARLGHQLSASEKNRAENLMIVDLMRNDLSRVCTDQSVEVTQLCELEGYQFVQHLVSVVQGQLRSGENVGSLLKACFPGGSVTGAPKIEAMQTIAELEPNPRGPYCGSIGYISSPTTADFNILIRTITTAHGYCQVPVGGGITARSQPESEEAETWTKAEGMLRAIGRGSD